MTGKAHSIRLVLRVSVVMALLAAAVVQGGRPAQAHPHLVEIFTTTESPLTGEATINGQELYGKTEFLVYELDAIQHIEIKLSEGLTDDPEQSRQLVLRRFQQLHEKDRARMQRASMGLAKAVQYGIDRYPAIVFDGKAAIYGVTGIDETLHWYQKWQKGRKQ